MSAAAVGLRPGDQLHCPHCRHWHTVEQPYGHDSTAAQTHLYVTCPSGRYYVGAVGGESRWRRRTDRDPLRTQKSQE